MIDFIEQFSKFDLVMLFWVLPSLITYLICFGVFKGGDSLKSIGENEWASIHGVCIFYPMFYFICTVVILGAMLFAIKDRLLMEL